MAIALRPVALIYRIIAVFVIAAGIIRVAGLFTPHPAWASFTFFTVLSNVLCLGWMIAAAVVTGRDLRRRGIRGLSTPSARFGGAVMMAITVTMIVYLVVLVPATFQQAGDYEPFTLTDNLIHIITPCIVIADWLLFAPKGAFRWFEPLLWTIIPYLYLLFAFSYSALGGRFGGGLKYPYPFMNVDVLGVGGVVAYIAGITVALVAAGYVYVVADKLLARLRPVPAIAAEIA